jgi:hypothetical protein
MLYGFAYQHKCDIGDIPKRSGVPKIGFLALNKKRRDSGKKLLIGQHFRKIDDVPLEIAQSQIMQVANGMRNDIWLPCYNPTTCRGCQYKEACRLYQSGQDPTQAEGFEIKQGR